MVTACVHGRAASRNSQDVEYVSRASSGKRVSIRFRPTVIYRWHAWHASFAASKPVSAGAVDTTIYVSSGGVSRPFPTRWRRRGLHRLEFRVCLLSRLSHVDFRRSGVAGLSHLGVLARRAGLTYETMFSALGTYGLSRTQHYHNIQQADTVGDDII